MNKKELNEIKKTFNPEKSVINKICGCYVDNEKNIRFKTCDSYHTLSEEESFKYFEIFKKTLSGTIGKNLFNIDFPLESESEGSTQNFLYKLLKSDLEDQNILDEYYKKIIDNYVYESNYYIILIHGIYDVPGKTSDGLEMFDASDSIYEYILTSICPVNLDKAGLSYDTEKNRVGERIRNWIVSPPSNGFLFPAFNDRTADIHSAMYFSKDSNNLQREFLTNILGEESTATQNDQKETFAHLITNTLGDECDFNTVKAIHENINEMIERNSENPDPLILTKNEITTVFEESEVSDTQLETLEKSLNNYKEENEKNIELMASNVVNTRTLDVKAANVSIKVNSDFLNLIREEIIDGKKCLVIELSDNVEINGIPVK